MIKKYEDSIILRKGLGDFSEPPEEKIPIAIHKNTSSGVIVINYPGFRCNMDGHRQKWLKLANRMQKRVGAVIRMANFEHGEGVQHYRASLSEDLRAVIEYAIAHAMEICGARNPALYLMGHSAGASAIAAIAYMYPMVKKILLIAPSGDVGHAFVERGIIEFAGEVYILSAKDDDVVQNTPEYIYRLAIRAQSRNIVSLVHCDHHFTQSMNSLILSNAPDWAFLGKTDFPSPKGGIRFS